MTSPTKTLEKWREASAATINVDPTDLNAKRLLILIDQVEKLISYINEARDNWCIKPICECYLCRADKEFHDALRKAGE